MTYSPFPLAIRVDTVPLSIQGSSLPLPSVVIECGTHGQPSASNY